MHLKWNILLNGKRKMAYYRAQFFLRSAVRHENTEKRRIFLSSCICFYSFCLPLIKTMESAVILHAEETAGEANSEPVIQMKYRLTHVF